MKGAPRKGLLFCVVGTTVRLAKLQNLCVSVPSNSEFLEAREDHV